MATLTHSPTAWLRFHAEAGIEHADTFAAISGAEGVGDDPEIERILAEADDLALELGRVRDQLADEVSDAAAIEERLGLLYGLLRKYGLTDSDHDVGD